jgi:predicted nucleic acid-binding protein
MAELAEGLLHGDKTRTSTSEACFHEIREVFSKTAFWDRDTNAWRQTVIYLVRVSTH